MRRPRFLLVVVGLMILFDFYVFQAVRMVAFQWSPEVQTTVFIGYWILSALALLAFLFLPYLHLEKRTKGLRSTVFAILVALFFAKFVASLFFIIDDLRRCVQWIAAQLFVTNHSADMATHTIHRSLILSWTGLVAGGSLFSSLLYGFTNKYNYRVKKVPLRFANLPAGFRGVKIIHISDIHSGSFTNKAAVQKGVETILQQKADLILFTGDLVNNKAEEMTDYIELFRQLQAPLGVYATLGNHDYGDYVQWPDAEAKRQNLERLKAIHAQMGWKLLMNEHVVLEKGGDQIALLGIENWSAKARFPKYGRLSEAYAGTQKFPFKILMSHDPSHWATEVQPKYPDIDLMLAGHTHGMQFGVDLPWFKWSPVSFVYKQWSGLYEAGHQKLYVNPGFGFIGYPGRVGILPEITVLQLT